MRHVLLVNKNILYKKRFIKKLTLIKTNNFSGRNNTGKICVFSKGKKAHRSSSRILRTKGISYYNIPGSVYRFEYDPNRSSFISLVVYPNKIYCYVLGVKNINIGDFIYWYNNDIDFNNIVYNKGDTHFLRFLPLGSLIHNIELYPNKGGIFSKSAGTYSILLKKHFKINKALIKLPSKKKIYISLDSSATLGIVSNESHFSQSLGKAGRSRWLGYKSIVRGVAMNPIDHPHGGGEGKKWVSLKKTPWGKIKKWINKKYLHAKHIYKR